MIDKTDADPRDGEPMRSQPPVQALEHDEHRAMASGSSIGPCGLAQISHGCPAWPLKGRVDALADRAHLQFSGRWRAHPMMTPNDRAIPPPLAGV